MKEKPVVNARKINKMRFISGIVICSLAIILTFVVLVLTLIGFYDYDNPEFAHVSYKGIEGYALRAYLSPRATIYKVARCEEWISLRDTPSLNGETVDQIPLGTYVIFVKTSTDDFWYVNYNGKLGYVLSIYFD